MRTPRTLEAIETNLKRLHSRLKRTVNAIDKLERAKRRIKKGDAEDGMKHAPAPKPKPPTLGESCDQIVTDLIMSRKPLYETMSPADLEAARATSAELNLAIPSFPSFLRRR